MSGVWVWVWAGLLILTVVFALFWLLTAVIDRVVYGSRWMDSIRTGATFAGVTALVLTTVVAAFVAVVFILMTAYTLAG